MLILAVAGLLGFFLAAGDRDDFRGGFSCGFD